MSKAPAKGEWIKGLAPTDVLMREAWASCLVWAVTSADIQKAYRLSTGRRLTTGARTAIEVMIDKATGFEEREHREFVEWFNTNIWGDLNTVAGKE